MNKHLIAFASWEGWASMGRILVVMIVAGYRSGISCPGLLTPCSTGDGYEDLRWGFLDE